MNTSICFLNEEDVINELLDIAEKQVKENDNIDKPADRSDKAEVN